MPREYVKRSCVIDTMPNAIAAERELLRDKKVDKQSVVRRRSPEGVRLDWCEIEHKIRTYEETTKTGIDSKWYRGNGRH